MQTRDQRRLTLAIFGVGVLAVIVSTSTRSGFWDRLFPEPKPTVTTAESTAAADALLGREPSAGGEPLVVPSETQERRPVNLNEMIDRTAAARVERASTTVTNRNTDEADRKLPQAMLREINDDTLGIPSTEKEAYFAAIRMAEKVGQNLEQKYPEGDYAVFQNSPDYCRGKVWKIRGHLRQLTRVQGDSALFGVSTVYDAWVSLPNSAGGLVHVHATSADPGLPIAEFTGDNPPFVELSGIFFKKEAYFRKGKEGMGELASAPLLLAARMTHIKPESAKPARADQLTPWLGWLMAIVCVGVVLVIWQFRYSDSVFRHTRAHHWTSTAAVASFDGVEAVTIQESLRKLADGVTEPERQTGLPSKSKVVLYTPDSEETEHNRKSH